jgi:hypothetical protein
MSAKMPADVRLKHASTINITGIDCENVVAYRRPPSWSRLPLLPGARIRSAPAGFDTICDTRSQRNASFAMSKARAGGRARLRGLEEWVCIRSLEFVTVVIRPVRSGQGEYQGDERHTCPCGEMPRHWGVLGTSRPLKGLRFPDLSICHTSSHAVHEAIGTLKVFPCLPAAWGQVHDRLSSMKMRSDVMRVGLLTQFGPGGYSHTHAWSGMASTHAPGARCPPFVNCHTLAARHRSRRRDRWRTCEDPRVGK